MLLHGVTGSAICAIATRREERASPSAAALRRALPQT